MALVPAKPPVNPAEKFRHNDSLCARMTPVHITNHIQSLVTNFNAIHSPAMIRERMRPILLTLMSLQNIDPFTVPVDPVKLKIPDYDEVIKRRMDLGTIKKNLGTCSAAVVVCAHGCSVRAAAHTLALTGCCRPW